MSGDRFIFLPAVSLAILAASCCAAQAQAPAYCAPGGQVEYPLDDSLRAEAHRIRDAARLVSFSEAPAIPGDLPPDELAAARQLQDDMLKWQQQDRAAAQQRAEELVAELDAMPATRRDALLLTAIDAVSTGENALQQIVLLTQPDLIRLYQQALQRNGLQAQADLISEGIAVFGTVDSPYDRYPMLVDDATGQIRDTRIDAALRDLNDRWNGIADKIPATAMQILRSDAAETERMLQGVSKDRMLRYLAISMRICADDWRADTQEAPTGDAGQIRRDLAMLSAFSIRAGNGGVGYYLLESEAGADLPELVQTFKRNDMSRHGSEFGAVLAQFGEPYPRDLAARQDRVEAMTFDLPRALGQLDQYIWDNEIKAAIERLALTGDVMPDLEHAAPD